jgi:hypothetical protein
MIFNFRLAVTGLALLYLLVSCDNNKINTKPDPTIAAKQVINEHFHLLNAHNLKGLVAQYENKARIITSDWDGVSFGPQGADQLFHQLFYISPDAKYLVDNMIANDSTVVVEYDVVGLKEKYNSSIRYDLRYCSIYKIHNNQIGSEATYSNTRLYHNK